MRFEILLNDKTIHEAACLVTRHIKDDMLLALVCAEKSFNHTKDTGKEVAQKIVDSDLTIKIKPYKTWSPLSKSIGYARGSTVYANTRKLYLPLKDRVENFAHEPMHLLGYSHKGNRVTAYNLETVPYKVAAIFVKYLESIGKL